MQIHIIVEIVKQKHRHDHMTNSKQQKANAAL